MLINGGAGSLERVLSHVDGVFALVWWDGLELHLVRDRFGAEPMFYAQTKLRGSTNGSSLVFGSRARDVVASAGLPRRVSDEALAEYLTYAYVPGTRTLYDGVARVPAGGHVRFTAHGQLQVERWYRLSYAVPLLLDEAEIKRGYREKLEAAVVRRLGGGRIGSFLSGGMDSSSAVTFARRHTQDPIHSFGFRCSGGSFDESHYARALAEQLSVQHTEVEYGEEQALSIVDAIAQMEVPFCDIGIEIGTWILSRAAGSQVDYVLTGDGGDEIWASHPVYAAQKMMIWYDRVPLPNLLRRALVAPTKWVRDSDDKRNLAVVAKRLIPSPQLDPELGHFRWRTYFTREDLREVVTDDLARRIADFDTYEVVRESLRGYEGPDDNLSRWMYSDYTTAASFYFSRLLFTRAFGVEARMPFFDRDLVEFGVRIPARLKLEGVERTKRLFREAMEGILPNVINHRRDKLGHSVPLKNWLRADGALGKALTSTLRSEQFRARNILKPQAVERLIEEHATRRDNHSHRLWGFFVLEHWMRSHID
jgi:asparagine synthase (glutamine-hydrolysing)